MATPLTVPPFHYVGGDIPVCVVPGCKYSAFPPTIARVARTTRDAALLAQPPDEAIKVAPTAQSVPVAVAVQAAVPTDGEPTGTAMAGRQL